MCGDPRTCVPSDSVYAFVSIAFDGEDWSKESEGGGKGMKAER